MQKCHCVISCVEMRLPGIRACLHTSIRFAYPSVRVKPSDHGRISHVQALVTIDPGVLFVLEGTGQADKYPGMSWGNGFAVDPSLVALYNLSSARGFFDNLAAVPELASRTILSGHVYGPETTASI